MLTKRIVSRFSIFLRYHFYIWLALSFLASFFLLLHLSKLELFPTTIFAIFTAFFSYGTYRFSKEKFRLDLFEKRFEIYEKTLEFFNFVTKYGSLRENDNNKEEIIKAFQAAHESFRGVGFHRTRALFGEDIHGEFQKLNESFAWLASYSDPQTGEGNRKQWAMEKARHVTIIVGMLDNLPELFHPYIYFGDYKR